MSETIERKYGSHIAGPPGDTSNGQLCSRCGTELSYFGPELGKRQPPLWPVGTQVSNGSPCPGLWQGDSGLPNLARLLMGAHSVRIMHVPPGSKDIEVEIPKEWLVEDTEEEPPF